MKLQIKTEANDTELIALEGALDFSSSPELRQRLGALAEKKPLKVLVDLKKVDYIDSSGLATFIELFQKIKRYQGTLAFFNLTKGVRNVFEVAKLESVFQLAGSQEDAIRLVSG